MTIFVVTFGAKFIGQMDYIPFSSFKGAEKHVEQEIASYCDSERWERDGNRWSCGFEYIKIEEINVRLDRESI